MRETSAIVTVSFRASIGPCAGQIMYEFAVTPAVTNIRRRGVEICEVVPNGLGAEMDLESGDRIIKVNGRVVRDYLDFRFQTAGETELVLEVRKKSGEDWEVELERAEGDLALDREVEEPSRSGGPHADARFGALGQDGVDDFDGPGRVPESVARNVEDDR